MIKRLTHSIDIDARPERVWQVFTDLPAYSEWNSFILHAEVVFRSVAASP